jgi:hypothetical protein
MADQETTADSLAARLRREIRAELEAELTRPLRDVVPPPRIETLPAETAPAPAVAVRSVSSAVTVKRTIPATDGRPEIPLPESASRADLSLPPALAAGLSFSYRTSDLPKTWADEDESATGYVNAHVNFASGTLVTIDVREYAIAAGEDAPAVTSGNTAAVGDEISAGIFWINPALLTLLLKDHEAARQAGITVSHVNFFAGTTEFEGVRFEHGSQWTTYELETGMLMSLLRGKNDPNVTKEVTYLRRRTLKIPWSGYQAPDWVAHARALTYQGSNIVTSPIALTMQTVTLSVELDSLHPEVLLARVSSRIETGVYAPEQDTWDMPCATTMLYPLWIAPEAIGTMPPGQVIDADPVTGFTITYRGLENLYAVIVEEGPLEQTAYYFDINDGILFGFRGHRPTPDGEGEAQIQSWLIARR